MTRTTESIRWRGGQVTRIEALTDAVFGFAITLLVVRLDVPSTATDLLGMVGVGFLSIATALLGPPRWSAMLSGFSYFLIGPAQYVVGVRYARLRKLAEAEAPSAAPLQPV